MILEWNVMNSGTSDQASYFYSFKKNYLPKYETLTSKLNQFYVFSFYIISTQKKGRPAGSCGNFIIKGRQTFPILFNTF